MAARIRIEAADIMGGSTRVFYVDEDGTETDISRVCTGVDIHIDVREPNTATLSVLFVESHASAELTDLLVTKVTGRRPWWKRTLREVTAFGSRSRRYIRA
jgi:hypothetical protein